MDWDPLIFDGSEIGLPERVEENQEEGDHLANIQNKNPLETCPFSGDWRDDEPTCQVAFHPRKTLKLFDFVIPRLGNFIFL